MDSECMPPITARAEVPENTDGERPAPPAPDSKDSPITPIAELKVCENWLVQGAVTFKSDIRKYGSGDGQYFSFNVSDESGEIRITAFNKEVDSFFSRVEKGSVYHISKATLKTANKKFSTVKNEYEIILKNSSTVVFCDNITINPQLHFDFIPISELENRNPKDIIDVIGVCITVEEVSQLTTKAGREVSKRELNLMDSSGKRVRVTLWGEQAETFNGTSQPIVAVKAACLSGYGGRSLSASFSSTIIVNPDIPEALKLKAWYDTNGKTMKVETLTHTWSDNIIAKANWKTLNEMKNVPEEQIYKVVADVVDIQPDNCIYKACPQCNRKLDEVSPENYCCAKCKKFVTAYNNRFALKVKISDPTAMQWVTCFQETAEILLGHNAQTLAELRKTDGAEFKHVLQKVTSTRHVFINKVKLGKYKDGTGVQTTVMEILPVTHSSDAPHQSAVKD